MVKLEEHKQQTENKPIAKPPLPAKVYIPLSQHLGKACMPCVNIGDAVSLGQKIATSQAQVSSPIHASVSGKVDAIGDWPHPVLGRAKAIVIESDGLDKCQVLSVRCQEEINSLTPEGMRNIIFEAGIVGMGGAGFPAHIKLNPPKPVDTLIINGAECEPYLTSDYRLMIEKTGEISLGIELVAKCLGVKKIFIAIEDNKPKAIKAFKAICDKRYAISILKSQYPQGGEKQLIKSILRREVPPEKLPFDVGAVVQNVATVYAIYEAAYLNKPLYERVVTVTGDCLERPKNLLVRIGTPIKELILQCGPLKKEPEKVIFGGPMMGIAQFSLDTPVIKSTGGLILFAHAKIEPQEEEAACLRCGRCVEYCPLGLAPCLISMASEKEKWDLAKSYGCLECMECGLCNYICPRKRNIVQSIKQAKAKLAK